MQKKSSSAREDTKARLVEAAGPVFARVGFRAATVQEICERAGANIAAVNYHFRDKLGLYREVLRSSRASSTGMPQDRVRRLPPEERLRGFVHALLTHLFGEGRPSWFAQVIAHEMAEPTPALRELIEQEARPGFEWVKQIVSELLGLPVNANRVVLCANSIMGQCLHYFHSRAVVAELWPELKMTGEQIDQIANHITEFSLLALTRMGSRKGGASKSSTRRFRPKESRSSKKVAARPGKAVKPGKRR